jgi:hypothetical protein
MNRLFYTPIAGSTGSGSCTAPSGTQFVALRNSWLGCFGILTCYKQSVRSATSRPPTSIATNTRNNLPSRLGRKRGESEFVLKFSRAYLSERNRSGGARSSFPARELPVAGFGVADFVWFVWTHASNLDEGRAVEIRDAYYIRDESLLAFEMKLTDWRKALSQACRYRYFSNAAYVVLPPAAASLAREKLGLFRHLKVGLWSFNAETGRITRHYSPRPAQPLSQRARHRAVEILMRIVKAPRTPGTRQAPRGVQQCGRRRT